MLSMVIFRRPLRTQASIPCYTVLWHVQSTKDHALTLKCTRTLTLGTADFFRAHRRRGHRGRQNSRRIADYRATTGPGTARDHRLGGPGPPRPAPGPPGEPYAVRTHRAFGPFHSARVGTLANAPRAALRPPTTPQRPPHAPSARPRHHRARPRPQRPLWSMCSDLRARKYASKQ